MALCPRVCPVHSSPLAPVATEHQHVARATRTESSVLLCLNLNSHPGWRLSSWPVPRWPVAHPTREPSSGGKLGLWFLDRNVKQRPLVYLAAVTSHLLLVTASKTYEVGTRVPSEPGATHCSLNSPCWAPGQTPHRCSAPCSWTGSVPRGGIPVRTVQMLRHRVESQSWGQRFPRGPGCRNTGSRPVRTRPLRAGRGQVRPRATPSTRRSGSRSPGRAGSRCRGKCSRK